jgi:putative transposase
MMQQLRLQYPIPLMSRLLNVSDSGYYEWSSRPLSRHAMEEKRLEVEIQAAHKRNRKVCGAERLQHDLAKNGIRVGVCRIKRIKRKLGLLCKQKRKFKATTYSKHGLPVAENQLNQHFQVSEPDKAWVSDITYIPTDEGWLYVAAHKDLFTHEIVGYAMGERMTRNLISESLTRAVESRRPAKGLIHHSDRGSQYCSIEYRKLLNYCGLIASMSGKGNCYDNAPMESFWGMLKQELTHHCHYITRHQAQSSIKEYIEIFYNRQRIQAGLGYLSPAVFAHTYSAGLIAA